MSDKPINLGKVRKDRARAEKRARADQNALRFGRTKAEKEQDRKAREKARKTVDGHKLEP